MGVYIPNMKSMFKTCGDCPLDAPNCRLWEELENINTERHPKCPLIEIVRCEECARRKKNGFCLEHNRYERNDDGFCSYGERKADDRG